MSRQLGGALGVAILVALLGKHTNGPAALAAFNHLWILSATLAALTGAFSLLPRHGPARQDLL
jgi:hypothetical protein